MALYCWSGIVLSTLDKFAPLQVKMNRPANKSWYSPYLCRLRRVRDRLFNRSEHLSHSHRLSNAYRKVRNLYVSEQRNAERLHFKQIGSTLSSFNLKANPHRWWSTLKSLCGLKKDDRILTLVHEGKLHLSSEAKAECLNAVFLEQCSAPRSSSNPKQSHFTDNIFQFDSISEYDVWVALKSLPLLKAPGCDGISHKVLKSCALPLSRPLCYI